MLFCADDNFRITHPAHDLNLIYDDDSLTQILSSHHLPPLADFATFSQQAFREVIVIHYISPKESHELKVMKGMIKEKIQQAFKKDSVADCRHILYNYSKMIEDSLNHELVLWNGDPFHIVKYWCVNMSHFNTPSENAAKMGIRSKGDVTVVVVNWRGTGSKQFVRGSAVGVHINKRVALINSSCGHYISWSSDQAVKYSPQVLQTAARFTQSLGILPGDMFAAVHVRSEKLGLREPRLPGVTLACFRELTRLKNTLASKYPTLKFVHFTDYGPYSSDTCRKCRGGREIWRYLKEGGVTPKHFDPVQFNVTVDNGFAAAVESHFISSASFLFLCGGGGFQTQMATRFRMAKHQADDANIFRICSNDSDITRLLKPP